MPSRTSQPIGGHTYRRGMDIEAMTAAGRIEFKGQTYYFCGSNCKEKFDLNPAHYTGYASGTPKSDQGCCS
jgi:YHS domain-containing protein